MGVSLAGRDRIARVRLGREALDGARQDRVVCLRHGRLKTGQGTAEQNGI